MESSPNNFVFIALCGFLLFNLAVGLYYGRDIKNLKDYALGGRNFTTPLLVATITATIIGGGSLFTSTGQIYKTGLFYAIAWMGVPVYLLIISNIFVPRMGEFLGTLSVADAMGKLYGTKIRTVSAISASLASICSIAVQFKVLSAVLSHVFRMEGDYAIIVAAAVTVFYSAFGGIRSVTFTDFIQFFTFLVVLPLLAATLWGKYSSDPLIANTNLDPVFDIKTFIGFDNPKFWELGALFLLFAIPEFSPALFQRIAAGRDVFQVKRAFSVSACIFLFIILVVLIITFCIHAIAPEIANETKKYAVMYYIMDNYTNQYTLAALVIGVAAMTMSTADSRLNSAAVMIGQEVHYYLKKIDIEVQEVLFARLFSAVLGVGATFFALHGGNLFQMLLWSLKLELVSVPLMIAVLGFRSTGKAVVASMLTSIAIIIGIELNILKIEGDVKHTILRMIASAIGLFGFHYLFQQKGGWVGIKDKTPLNAIVGERRRKWRSTIAAIKNFNFLTFCRNSAPKEELTYTGFGIFALTSLVATSYSLAADFSNLPFITLLYQSLLILTFSFISYPIWPLSIKKELVPQIMWNIVIFLILVVFSTIALLYSGFSHLQSMIFTANLIITLILVRTRFGLFMILCGVLLGMWLFQRLFSSSIEIPMQTSTLIYLSVLLGSTFVIFLQPVFRAEETSKFLNKALNQQINKQSLNMLRLASYKQEFAARLDIFGLRKFKEMEDKLGKLSGQVAADDKLDPKELSQVAVSLVDGSKYLISVLNQMDEFMKIETSLKSASDFVDAIIEKSKELHGTIDFATKLSRLKRDIECDHGLMLDILTQMISAGLSRCSGKREMPPISLSVTPTNIRYDLDFTEMFKEITEGVDIKITFPSNVSYNSDETESIRQGRYPHAQFAEWMKVIYAHYGNLKITPESSSVTFLVTIPLTLSKVRPKKMDLPDAPGQIFTMVHNKIVKEKKIMKEEVLKSLSDAGIDKTIIANIMNKLSS